jgi:uncharacterized protein YukJ
MTRAKSTLESHFNATHPGIQYGVLRGRVVQFGTEDGTQTPHFQIIVEDDVPQIWRVAVNVRSDDGSNDQAIAVDPFENHPILSHLGEIAVGYTALPIRTSGCTLDYVRQPLFDPQQLKILPPFDSNESGLEDHLQTYAQEAKDGASLGAEIYVWGSKFDVGNHPVAADLTYGDKVGIHDVHMNQGNPPPHDIDNGVYQDGGIIFRFADRTVGFFMKFQSQVGRDDAGRIVIPGIP